MVDLISIEKELEETRVEIETLEQEARALLNMKVEVTATKVFILNGKMAIAALSATKRMLAYSLVPLRVEAPGEARANIALKCQNAVAVLKDSIRSLEIMCTALLTLGTFLNRKESENAGRTEKGV